MRTSYRLGHWLDQPYLLSEVVLEEHPISPFAFRYPVLVLLLWAGAEVLELLVRFAPAAAAMVAAAMAAAVAAPRELVLEVPQAYPARRQA